MKSTSFAVLLLFLLACRHEGAKNFYDNSRAGVTDTEESERVPSFIYLTGRKVSTFSISNSTPHANSGQDKYLKEDFRFVTDALSKIDKDLIKCRYDISIYSSDVISKETGDTIQFHQYDLDVKSLRCHHLADHFQNRRFIKKTIFYDDFSFTCYYFLEDNTLTLLSYYQPEKGMISFDAAALQAFLNQQKVQALN